MCPRADNPLLGGFSHLLVSMSASPESLMQNRNHPLELYGSRSNRQRCLGNLYLLFFFFQPSMPLTYHKTIDELRQILRKQRQQLGLRTRIKSAKYLQEQLLNQKEYRISQKIAFYWAVNGELSCHFAMKQALKEGKQCYLPVLSQCESGPCLQFAPYNGGKKLVNNQYRIPEPITPRVEPNELDLVVVPLVAVDNRNNRLGMGGGYYDRTFSMSINKRPILIGVGYYNQLVKQLKTQPWDVPMDKIILTGSSSKMQRTNVI